jgi:sec-independent protein translocase protein TatC
MAKTRRSLDPESSTMSLGDHLEELRARLILALLGLVIGAVASLAFGKHILHFMEKPYNGAIRARLAKIEAPRVQSDILAFVELYFETLTKELATDPNTSKIDPNQVEFFRQVSVKTVAAWAEKMKTLAEEAPLPLSARLQTLAPAEAFMAYMKIAFIAGLLLTSPWVFYQIWMFVAAGLYPHERRYVRTAVPFSAGLFIVGALFFLFAIAPLTLRFFLSFGDIVSVANNWTLQRYISFITILMLVFGIAFQTPIAVYVLVRTGLVSLPALRRSRKYVLLTIFIVAAVATPPDIISQVSLGIPLYGLFEVGMILAYIAEKKTREQKAKESAS